MMARAAAKKTEPDVEFFDQVEQGSDDWFKLRLGVPTASCFSIIMADGQDGDPAKTRRDYLYKLAGEILTGRPGEGKVKTAAMQRGTDMEPRACEHYARNNIVQLEQIGFARRKLPSGRYIGASPDRLMNKRRKGLEVKTMAPHLIVAMLERAQPSYWFPPEHRWQVFGTMLVLGIDEVDLQVFYDDMPVQPKFTVTRHEPTIVELHNALQVFDHELDKIVKRCRAKGGA